MNLTAPRDMIAVADAEHEVTRQLTGASLPERSVVPKRRRLRLNNLVLQFDTNRDTAGH